MTKALKTEASRITKILVENYKPEKVILFGSIARNEETKDSDLDFFIIKDTNKNFFERLFEAKDNLNLSITYFDSNNTMESLYSLAYAKEHPDKKVLLVSCDPAHSISDSLGEKIGSDPTPVSGFPNLEAREIDALKLFDSFDKENQKTITTILDRGTYLDPEDINEFVGLSLPGIDELMALLEIARIVEKNKYDLVIVDTAPAGHTLRLLELPKLLKSVIELLNLMQDKHRTMVKSLTRRYNQDKADEFIVNLIPSLQEQKEDSNTVLTKKDKAVVDYLILRIVGVIIGILLLLYALFSIFRPQLLFEIVPIGFG